MECVNPNCTKAERVKALFPDAEEDEVSCPFCKQSLQRIPAIKKSKEETTLSTGNDDSTGQNERKSSEAIKESQGDQAPVTNKDDKKTPLKDEKAAVRVIASQHVIEDKVHSVQYVQRIEGDTTKGKQVSDFVKEQQSEDIPCPGTGDQGLQATPSNTASYESHTDSTQELNVGKTISPELDHSGRDLSEQSKVNDTLIPGQSNNLKKEAHTAQYCAKLQISLNEKRKQLTAVPNNQDSHKTMKNQQQQSSDQKPNGINEEFPNKTGQIACVFGNTNKSLPASGSCATHDQDSSLSSECNQLEQNPSQTKDQTAVNKYDDNSEGKKKSMDPNPEKNTDKGYAADSDSKALDQAEEDDDKSDFDSNDDQESESGEESQPLEQRRGPVPYGKDVIKQKKKERINRRKQSGKNTSAKKEAKNDDDPQAKEMEKFQERQKQTKISGNMEANEGTSSSPLEQKEPDQQQQTTQVVSNTTTTAEPTPSVNATNDQGECVTNEGISSSSLEQKEPDQQQLKVESNKATPTAPPSVNPMNEDRQTTDKGTSFSPLEQKESEDQQRQKIQVEANKTTPTAPPSVNPMNEDCVTIVFHALLSPDFNFKKKKHEIEIRIGYPEFGSFLSQPNCVNIKPISKTEEKFRHIRGEMVLPVRLLDKYRSIPYKYVVWSTKEKIAEWEYSEFADYYHKDTFVNRSLVLFNQYNEKGGIFNRYDGVIYPEPPKENSSWQKFLKWWGKNGFNRDEVLKNRKHAAKTFLPRWKGFIKNTTECKAMSATEALEQIHVIKQSLTYVYLSPGYANTQMKIVENLEFDKILANFLKPKMEYNAKLSEKELESSAEVRVDRLVSSLAITHLIALYFLDLTYIELKDILHCLMIRVNGSGGCDFDEIHKHFPEEMWSHLVLSILYLMKAANKKHDKGSCPDVILAVPLVHFLRKDLKPFEEPEMTHPRTVKEWCLAEDVIQYKRYSSFVESILPKALPMFTLDPLLRRLFLHYTPLEDFPKLSESLDNFVNFAFPIHEICMALFYRLRSGVATKELDPVDKTLFNLMKRQTSKKRQESLEQSKALLFAKFSMSLLQELVVKVNPKDNLFFTGIQFAIYALCSVNGPEDERQTMENERHGQVTDDDVKHECYGIFYMIIDMVQAAVEKEFLHRLSSLKELQENELKIWTTLLNLNVSRKDLEYNWIENLVSLFEKRFKKMDNKYVVELFCELEMDEYHQDLVQSITQLAFAIVEQIVERGESERSLTTLQERSLRSGGGSSKRAGELLSRMITRAWNKAMTNKKVTDHDVLGYALTWKPWAWFISFHGSQEKQRILAQDANKLVQRVIGCLVTVLNAIADGSINVRTLMSLNQHQVNFIYLCRAMSEIQTKSEGNQKSHSVEDVERNLEERNEEYHVFKNMKEHVQHFIDICRSMRDIAFDIKDFQEKANCDMSDVRMADLCKRVPSGDDHAPERVKVVFFDCLPNMFPSILPDILNAYKSKTFQDIWKSNCKAVVAEKKRNEMLTGELTFLDVLDKVWPPSFEKWTLLAQTVYDGSIHLKDVHKNFRGIDSEKYLKEELNIMFSETGDANSFAMDGIASERVGQITRYRSLQNHIGAAKTVWKFKEALGLSGDFSIVEELRNQASEEFKDKDLKSIDERFAKAGEHLTVITLDNSRCLDAVIECEPLVEWLRETIKGDVIRRNTSAFSTLVDLAMISAGENDLEVDRISNFHTSCLNFAPLIFDLDKNLGFEELMKACKPVCEAVKQDSELPAKLAETCRHLEWLKAVQSSHGSVEMSSIMQAKAINASGVLRVGQITQDPNGGLSVSREKKDLENVLTLTVPIDPGTRDPRQQLEEEMEGLKKAYTLNDLKDLQSKLMLIAGKTAQLQNTDGIESTEEINRFVEVLEGMMRLGQVYIDLCEAGDVKYLDWIKEIHCSVNRLSTQRSVAEELAETSLTMEERLKKWQIHVQEKRHRYKQLNHYTTKQILVMRRELGMLREGASGDDMPLQVYTLLESVLPDIKSQDLNQVLFETLGFEMDVRRTTMSDSLLPSPTPQQGSFRSANLREKFQPFLLSVEKMEFDEEVAIAALKAHDVTKNHDVNENELITWCIDNGEDEEIVSEWIDKGRKDEDYVDFFPDLWQDDVETELEGSFLGNQGRAYINQAEDFAEDNLEDGFEQKPYLTLDELGSVLARLSSKCGKPEERKFPDYLSREKPNLLLVYKGDILGTVLTLYMQYGGNSLPTANEVLVCTHETTTEEIELFWWRAFEDKNQQMFCLVHPDILDYNVSQNAVNKLREFTEHAEGCRIIILCSTENEDRSHIIAALDEYRLNAVPSCASADVLSGYLTKQFTLSTSLTGYFNEERVSWIPAANLDSNSLSVRLVCSDRAGAGKSLVITRFSERISNLQNNLKVTKIIENLLLTVTVPLHGTVANTGPLLDGLWKHPVRGDLPVSRIVHLDVSPSVQEGLETLLFNLLVLGVLCDKSGRLWRRKPTDLYMIEMTTPMPKASQSSDERSRVSFVSLLPTTNCTTPKTTLQNLKAKQTTKSPLFDDQEYRSIPVQRACQYLKACDDDDVIQSLKRFRFGPERTVGTQAECLALIIKNCGMTDPSWSELKHFVDFLNSQLQDSEESTYCKPENVDDCWMRGTLAGFTSFVINFMVTMSRDFATPSLGDNFIASSAGLSEEEDDADIRPLQLRRRWESSPHPYIFFNQDRITMTFLGFHINIDGDLIDPLTKAVIESALMTKQLRDGLVRQQVNFETNYSDWSKQERIDKLCSVMGVKDKVDPDTSYELTIDNMKKILAIHMRFRCGIPVVIMGETGCGKTLLIRYMCALQAGPKGQRNMLLMKVHGGTSFEDIIKKVEQAEKMAAENEKKDIDTVLFFDEANTTNALGMIKEVMVDRRINGRPVGVGLRRLHFIAACNPYRRHTDKMIKKLESAGLGYSVKSEETKDKLGKIPLRHLVYRVHALPASMRPLVWDFGQLEPDIEELYIRQIVSRYVLIDKSIPGDETLVKAISDVLAAAQKYMRQQKDECSFVSLRDVERTMTVMTWFYQHRTHLRPQVTHSQDEDSDDSENEKELMDVITWSLVMSLGVCYHAKLRDRPRSAFRKAVLLVCCPPLNVNDDQEMLREIVECQKVMISELSLGPNIARNTALRENVFMMVVCIELRIPLFVIGKPGSSKSLAKTVVADNMQGDASKSELFKNFKLAHMVSYQCSPLSTPDGIVATFRQCRRLQENTGDRYASVVVLDEVGLAEDSPLMPLKTLHPLLEDGVTSSDDIIETDEKPTRVAFIGISNWALDPAKMNRGLMLMRGEPSKKELEDSAWGICAELKDVGRLLPTLLDQLAAGYADLYARQKEFESLRNSKREEFFGLRDFYSLVKMVCSIAAKKNGKPTWTELEHAIRRNFGGLDEIDAVEKFRKHVTDAKMQESEPVKTLDLLRASLTEKNTVGESRYLLVLTENYSALRIVKQELIKNMDDHVVIFGSSFPKDQEYTQVCRNINQIKVCMETGRTVVLLNLESLYESLYDALNQYYVYCADQKYVDLGLGSHRVKCRVDDSFRLIVIAEKEVVYKKFPIPLINRLEKHYLVTSKSLRRNQMDLAKDLKTWAEDFAEVRRHLHETQQDFAIGDAFIGYQSDTIPAMVLQACAKSTCYTDEAASEDWLPEVKERCQKLLLQCATPDAMARLSRTRLKFEEKGLWDTYFKKQEHTSLPACLKQLLDQSEKHPGGLLVQVSTHSRLLSDNNLADVCQATSHFKRRDIELLTLQQFQTEQQFSKQVREFFISLSDDEGILLVQCDSGDENFNLIACTRHLLMEQRIKRAEMLKEKLKSKNVPPVHIVIIIQLPRVKGGCVNFVGFQGDHWDSFHVDDLRPPTNQIPPIQMLIDRPISELLKPADSVSRETFMEEEELQQMNDDTQGDILTAERPLKQDRLSTNLGRFDPMVLLRRSVQAAAGRLKDDPVMAERTTERIDLILSLLPEDSSKMPDGLSFAKSLHLKIYRLLEEKDEKQAGTDLASRWVRNEALSGTSVHERGTFRKALQHKVLTEVEPLLAKVFAYADRDCNLDLLRDQKPWILRVWISIFDNQYLSEIYYEISSSRIREHVQVSGKGEHVFRCYFPFSWLIKEMIDELWRGIPHSSSRSNEREEDKLRRIMENSELRYILCVIQEEGKGDEAAKRYLHDFVHMIYKPNKETEDEEVQLVSTAVIAAAEKRCSGEFHLDFAAIHVAFNLIQSRLNNFRLLVQAEPGLTSILLERPSQLTIDVAGLIVCLEKLQPSLSDFENSDSKRNEWCGRVLNIRKTIEAMTSKEVFPKNRGEIDDYEDKEKELLKKCWKMWQRLSVVRLFIDHVCNMSQQTNAENVQNVFKLWKILGDDTNFLKASCICRLEDFLLECSQEHRKRNKCFEMTCAICIGQAKKPSVTPCGHCFCLECAFRWFSEELSCPKCRQPVPADYSPTESEHLREALNNVTSFSNQCNSFFMEVVSLFCFGYSPCGTLEEGAYKLLMDYVTGDEAGNTKQFSPFRDQGIDVNPVVRSFLLQQLLKSSDQKVKDYMKLFIERANDVVETDATSSVEVLVMCVQCMEDAFNSKCMRISELPLDQKMSQLERYFKTAAAVLCKSREDEILDINWLEAIAKTRFVLSKAADFMYQSRKDTGSETWSDPDVTRALNRLIVQVEEICVKTHLTTPRLFLLKQLSRKFGFESIHTLAEDFDWMLPPEARESSNVTQDRFLVYGPEYQTLRETISKAVISEDMGSIQEALQNMTGSASVSNVALVLGIYQEVTTNKQVVISETIRQSLENFIQQSEHLCDQSRVLARDLVTAETGGNIKDVLRMAADNPWDKSMMEIIVHLAAVLFSRDKDDLIGPLLALALRPGTTTDSFFPTMPDDPLQDVRSAVVGTLYECPNGHPYLVTECGRPMEKSKCRAPGCGAEIGGIDHQLLGTNRSARTTDLSIKGHCLGSPDERGTEPIPEREMSAMVTCLLRLLVHGSMLIGSSYHIQDICQIISPAIPEESILGFLWKHAMCDMNLLSKVSGRSVDDTALIVHMVLHNISEHAQMYQGHYDTLKTKDERKQWENNFSTSLVVPLMTNLESSIQRTMELIANDNRFGANPLLRQLYELESGVDDTSEIHPNCMALWRYRTPVTLDHVTRAFNESAHAHDEGCVVLNEFLKNERKLRAVRFLPDVVKLQNLLMDRYQRTLDKTETDKLKWKDFEKRLPKGAVNEYKTLRKSFRSAWDIMVATLAEQGRKGTLNKLSQYSVNNDSPMSMFIPATSGLGTYSITLVQFLVHAHNEFMELYKRNSVNTPPDLQGVPVTEVTCSQLVSYDADGDLLPLMQAHCHYSLEVGHGTLVEYDWTAIQRQLIDRLVRGRVSIDFKEGEYIKRAQVSTESVLTTLKTKVPQVELTVAIQNQIIHQYRSLQDVCEALSSLNIAIPFLASGGGKPKMLMSRYIHHVLKLPEDTGLRNSKAQEVCQIQHAVSLWRLLSIKRAKILTKLKQDPFEHLSPTYKESPSKTVELSVNAALRKMSEGCLDILVSVLFEVIVLRLNDSFDIDEDISLKKYLRWYLEDKDAATPIPEVEDIPDEVLLKHIVRFWQIVFVMSDKNHERRMQAT